MNILGINAFHGDSSAALIQDGMLVAAVEEERFTRIKHWAGFPAQSIRYCLEEGAITVKDLDHIAVSFDPKANIMSKFMFTLNNMPDLKSILDGLKRKTKSLGVMDRLAQTFNCDPRSLKIQIHTVEHHAAHIASAFFTSPFDKAAVLSVDGMGDFASTVMASGEGISLNIFDRVYYPHSIGFLYSAATMLMGFPHYGDEYKVMGLAPYGKPSFIHEFRKVIYPRNSGFELNLDYFNHHKKGISMRWDNGTPSIKPFHSKLMEDTFGLNASTLSEMTSHHENVAASLQCVTEEIILHLLNELYNRYPCDNLCLAGGVAMNSVANGKIYRHTRFKNVFIPAGATDNGGAFGAAFYVWYCLLGGQRQFIMEHAFWGPRYSDNNIESTINANKADISWRRCEEEELIDKVSTALCQGKIVGWYQGRMEFGARSLGNRSLLADPRRIDARDIINMKIKFREKFRPFAPSILEERVADFFEDNVPSPFMEKVVPIRKEKRPSIPAVTHVDGSGRLQTVNIKSNPLYYRLIKEFEKKTSIPLILNTSLNENEPIVCTPEEALRCFLRTNMDVMVLGNYYIERIIPFTARLF